MDLKFFLEHGSEHYLPHLSVDLVIIGYDGQSLKCLLLKMADKWLLPGGYIGKDESVEHAAERVFKERTGLGNPHLQFLAVMGERHRRFTEEFKMHWEKIGLEWNPDSWLNARFVSLAYYSLVDIRNTFPAVHSFDEAFGWFDFEALPDMWMDHADIVTKARNHLKNDLKHEELTFRLLPERFTMPELHQLHEAILETRLDRSRFQKKMLSTGLFERLPKRQKETPGSNPYQYTVKQQG